MGKVKKCYNSYNIDNTGNCCFECRRRMVEIPNFKTPTSCYVSMELSASAPKLLKERDKLLETVIDATNRLNKIGS